MLRWILGFAIWGLGLVLWSQDTQTLGALLFVLGLVICAMASDHGEKPAEGKDGWREIEGEATDNNEIVVETVDDEDVPFIALTGANTEERLLAAARRFIDSARDLEAVEECQLAYKEAWKAIESASRIEKTACTINIQLFLLRGRARLVCARCGSQCGASPTLVEQLRSAAIVDFTTAVSFDANCVEAFLGRARAYVDLGKAVLGNADLSKAKEILVHEPNKTSIPC